MPGEIDIKEVLAFPVGPVAVLCWHERPTIAALKATQDFFVAHYQGRDMALLTIVEPTAAPPESHERAHMLANMHRFTGLRVVASVIEGEGFKAAAIRAVMAGLNLALRQPYPIRIFATVTEAAPWLHERFPGTWSNPPQLVQAVERRRQVWRTSSGVSLGR